NRFISVYHLDSVSELFFPQTDMRSLSHSAGSREHISLPVHGNRRGMHQKSVVLCQRKADIPVNTETFTVTFRKTLVSVLLLQDFFFCSRYRKRRLLFCLVALAQTPDIRIAILNSYRDIRNLNAKHYILAPLCPLYFLPRPVYAAA